MKKALAIAAAGILATAGLAAPSAAQRGYEQAREWTIGPIVRGRNMSVGAPLHPVRARGGAAIDFPYPNVNAGHVHYVTRPVRSLAGARSITLRYRVDAAPGTRFVSRQGGGPGMISLFLQRRGDNWSGRGPYAHYRWYSPPSTVAALRPGTHTMTVRLDDNWGGVMGGRRGQFPREFADALASADQVGITLGSARARGHGVYATGPATLTILDFDIR